MSTATTQLSEKSHLEVLLVEDDPGTSRLVEEAFAEVNDGITTHTVEDGVVALDFLHQRGDYTDAPRPRLVLLDLGLPRKNGKSVLRELKTTADLRRIPVVIFSDSTARADVDDAYSLGANAYVTKPRDFTELVSVVEEINGFWLSVARHPN